MNGRAWLGTGRASVPEKLKQAVDGDSGLSTTRWEIPPWTPNLSP